MSDGGPAFWTSWILGMKRHLLLHYIKCDYDLQTWKETVYACADLSTLKYCQKCDTLYEDTKVNVPAYVKNCHTSCTKIVSPE